MIEKKTTLQNVQVSFLRGIPSDLSWWKMLRTDDVTVPHTDDKLRNLYVSYDSVVELIDIVMDSPEIYNFLL